MLNILTQISRWAIPVMFFGIVFVGLIKKIAVYEAFVSGAKNGFYTTARLAPNLLAMLVAIQIFRVSGALEIVIGMLRPITSLFRIPEEVLPLALMRPLSGSGSLGLMVQLFEEYGPDSLIGRLASAIMGSSETTFYVLTVYTGAVGIKRTRHCLAASLISDLVGFAAAVFIVFTVFM
ncbi:MAG: spore maturation protein [Firmicutes bacterium]|nr:spore maturation protein [Bacillota bacterium]